MTEQHPQIYVARVTPALAQRWLGTTRKNRNVRAHLVRQYADDMLSGRWLYTADSIKFDTDHALIDGQHRLHAVVLADHPVDLLVATGLHPDAQAVTDTGARRSAGDALTIAGRRDGHVQAAAARLAIRIDRGEERRRDLVSNAEIQEYAEAHPDLEDAVEIARHYKRDLPIPPSVLTYCAYRLAPIDADAVHTFLSGMAERALDGRTDPRFALMRRTEDAARNREFVPAPTHVAWIFRTWNCWRDGKPLAYLRMTTNSPGTGKQVPITIPTPH